METECTQEIRAFHPLGWREVAGQFEGRQITSDAGGVLLRQVEQVDRNSTAVCRVLRGSAGYRWEAAACQMASVSQRGQANAGANDRAKTHPRAPMRCGMMGPLERSLSIPGSGNRRNAPLAQAATRTRAFAESAALSSLCLGRLLGSGNG